MHDIDAASQEQGFVRSIVSAPKHPSITGLILMFLCTMLSENKGGQKYRNNTRPQTPTKTSLLPIGNAPASEICVSSDCCMVKTRWTTCPSATCRTWHARRVAQRTTSRATSLEHRRILRYDLSRWHQQARFPTQSQIRYEIPDCQCVRSLRRAGDGSWRVQNWERSHKDKINGIWCACG